MMQGRPSGSYRRAWPGRKHAQMARGQKKIPAAAAYAQCEALMQVKFIFAFKPLMISSNERRANDCYGSFVRKWKKCSKLFIARNSSLQLLKISAPNAAVKSL